MKTRKKSFQLKRHFLPIVLLLALLLVFSGCSKQSETATVPSESIAAATVEVVTEETTIPTTPEETEAPNVESISVAIYPYLPDVELFEKILCQEWEKLYPTVPLTLERWDCYSKSTECDVLLYDALMLTTFAENGVIQPITFEEIDDPDDIISFSMDGSIHDGVYYGVPFLLCGDILIYYKDDAAMAAVENVPQLYKETLKRRETDQDTGVVVYTMIENPYHYLDALVDSTGEYTTFEELPDCSNLDPQIVQHIIDLKASSVDISEYPPMDPTPIRNFCEGTGFAFFGVTENMSHMGDILDKVEMKQLSYAEEANIPMFYIDVTSISTSVTDPEKLQLCKELMNMIGSEAFMDTLLLESGVPQYILPARHNNYLKLADVYPTYQKLYKIVTNEQNRAFRVGSDFPTYLSTFPRLF